jgi:hypothetical protein
VHRLGPGVDLPDLQADRVYEPYGLDVLSYRQFENNTRIYGHAEQNGLPTIYQIEITDNGPPRSSPADSITVSTAAGYFAFGSVTNGDIQVR